MANLHVMRHPLIRHKISMLRCKDTSVKEFRELVHEIALLMAYEATRDYPLVKVKIETPLESAVGEFIPKQIALVPILRAGLGMVDALMDLLPAAKIGHIGLYRDHATLEPVEYYCKLPPDIAERQVIVLDPMLATGGSAVAAIEFIKRRGADKIKFMCIIASPAGVERLQAAHPEVEIFCGAMDRELSANGYILPGLGDAGDRIFGTS